jgi:hypothetical protein
LTACWPRGAGARHLFRRPGARAGARRPPVPAGRAGDRLGRVTSKHPGLAEGRPSWHIDAFDLQSGTAELAVNEVCLQGVHRRPARRGQFHPEATRPIVASWLANADPPPGREVTDPLFTGADGAWQQASANAGTFFSAWLEGSLTRR